ncbi:UPF0147 family protein [archaeon]|nr:UPF0147 family protein [archaeon]
MAEKEDTLKQEVDNVIEKMNALVDDRSVPKNIRAAVERARDKLSGPEEIAVKISGAGYELEDISNDINMPSHARTQIWELISDLEFLREKTKEK